MKQAREFPGLVGLDLAKDVTCRQTYNWSETPWAWNEGYGEKTTPTGARSVIDYGVKRNILRQLAGHRRGDHRACRRNATLEDVMRHKPHGVLLSNGPGDPAATGAYAIPTIKGLIERENAGVRHLPRPSDAGPRARRRRPRRWRRAITARTIR